MIRFFNVAAMLCILIAAGVVVSIRYFLPSLFAGAYKDFVVSVVVLAVGALAEIFGLRGRVLFIPVWVWGVVMVALHSYFVWGIAGVLLPVLIIVFAVWHMVKATQVREAAQWANAGVAFSELRATAEAADGATFWRLVQESLCLPVAGDLTPESCAHNLEVVQIAAHHESIRSNHSDLEILKTLESFLSENRSKEKPAPLPFDLKTKVDDLIQARRTESERVTALTKTLAAALEAQNGAVRRD